MKNNWLLLILGVIIISFSACLKSKNLKNDSAELISESSTAVLSIDLKSLMEKANMESVKQMDFYKNAIKNAGREEGEIAAQVLENPEKSGIDLSRKAYFFVNIKEKNNSVSGFAFNIADAKKLEDLILDGEGEIEMKEGISYLSNANPFTIAWKGNLGFAGMINKNPEEFQTAIFEIFNTKNSITNNSKAVKALSQNGDITYYFKTNILTKVFEEELLASQFFIEDNYLRDNHFWGSTSFEKGKIESSSEMSLSRELNADLKMIFADGSETNFSRYIPKENLMLSITGKLNVSGINQLLKDKSLNGLLNTRLHKMDLSADDIAKAIDGDMVLAVNNLANKLEPSLLFAIKIGDQEKLTSLLHKGETLGILRKKEDDFYHLSGFGEVEGEIIIKDELLIFSNNLSLLTKLKKGKLDKSESIDPTTYAAINQVFGIYANYEAIFELTKNLNNRMELSSFNIKEAIFKFDWNESTSTVRMKDDAKNALHTIIESVNQQYIESKEE